MKGLRDFISDELVTTRRCDKSVLEERQSEDHPSAEHRPPGRCLVEALELKLGLFNL